MLPDSKAKPARLRPHCGKAAEEKRQSGDFWLTKG
jgi:hypothetical protein